MKNDPMKKSLVIDFATPQLYIETPPSSPPAVTTPPPELPARLDFENIVCCAGPCDSWDDVSAGDRPDTQLPSSHIRSTYMFANEDMGVSVDNALLCQGCYLISDSVVEDLNLIEIYRRYWRAQDDPSVNLNLQ